MIEVRLAQTASDLDGIRALWQGYWSELGFTPCFQGFSDELAGLPGRYASPSGCLLIAMEAGAVIGAVAFRKVDDASCEAKRLYVAPAHRGRGISRRLMERLIAEARAVGYRRLVGDTMPVMQQALDLYERMGFVRSEGDPGCTPGAIYIELALLPTTTGTA